MSKISKKISYIPHVKEAKSMQTTFGIKNLLKEGIKELKNFGIKNNNDY